MTVDISKLRPEIAIVRQWSFAEESKRTGCPFLAGGKLHEGPEIFFNLSDDHRNVDGGTWVVTPADMQREVLQQHELFSSQGVSGFAALLGEDWPLIPVELDAPDHMKYRQLINPLFSPARIKELEESLRVTAIELIDGLRDKGKCDFIESFARELPIIAFLRLMGLPLEEISTFRDWEDKMMHSGDLAVRSAAARSAKDYLVQLIEERRARPTGDLISILVQATIDDEKLTDEALIGLCMFLYIGGLDTVQATLGFVFASLAENPQLQTRLRENPAEIAEASEEFLRAFGTVVVSRYLTRDHEFHGVAMRKGDRIQMPLGVGSRDPRIHEHPDTIDLDRHSTRNISFGAGPHRCVGSHLARKEIHLSIEEWLKRIPEFRIAPGGKPLANVVTVWGLDYLHLEW